MGGENLQKYFCRPLPSAAGPAYYYEIVVGGNNPARALVPGERQATLDQGSGCLTFIMTVGTGGVVFAKKELIFSGKDIYSLLFLLFGQ